MSEFVLKRLCKYFGFSSFKCFIPRANGAKRRSGRQPETRVTKRALDKLKVVHGRRVFTLLISKIWRTIKMLKIYFMQYFVFCTISFESYKIAIDISNIEIYRASKTVRLAKRNVEDKQVQFSSSKRKNLGAPSIFILPRKTSN